MNLAAHTLVYSAARCSLIPAPESARRQGKHKRKRRNRLAGATATLFASRDATIVGSSVLADRDLDVIAGRDVNLLAAENRFTEDYRFKSSGSSLAIIPGPAPRQTLYGKTEMSQDSAASGNQATASLLSANGGALTIIAGTDASHAGTGRGNVTSEGADLLARQTVRIEGNAVSLLASDSRSQFDSVTKTKSITVGAALAGTVGSLITRAYDMAEASRQGTGNRRLDNALALKAGYDGWKAYDNLGKALAVEADGAAAADGAKGNGSAFGVSVSVGVSKMKSSTHEASHSQRGASIQAEHINITARDTDITAVGAKLQADGDITLDAQRNIDLLAAVNTEAIRNRSKGSSASLGVTVGIGQQTGISIQIGASQMKGKADGDATTYDNTEIVAGKTLTLKSGQDTTLQGAQVAGERVVADIGGNLSIETLQDQSRYKNRQSESGFSVSLCIPPICYGASSGTVSAANQKIDHSYRSAQGQSGIAAGEGGFEINVGGDTHLKGGAITSQATADQNTLSTRSLSYEDLTNTQHTEASSSSFSFSGSADFRQGFALPSPANGLGGQAAGNLLGNLAGQNGLPDDNSESSQTLAVISPATITLTGNDAASREAAEELTRRDPETANQALTDTLTLQDAARIERQMQEAKQNAAAANLIGQTVAGLIGDLADQMKKPINDATLRQALDEKQAAADKGGPPLTNVEQYELNRLNGEGMSSEKAAQTLANPEAWANYDNWQEGSLNKTILHGLAGIIQAKVGDGNALVGAAAGALNEALLPEMEKFLDAQNITDPEARKGYLQLGSALLGAGLGAVADGTNGAALGGTVAYNATTYNYLSHPENKERAEARKNCASGNESACQRADELDALDRQRDMEFHAACDGALRATDGCKDATRLMLDYVATYFPKQDEKIYLPDDFLKTAHQDELQSYRDLLQAANKEALQNGTDSQRPDLYNSDLYGVVDPNSHDLYVMVKIGDQWNVVSKTDKVFTSEAGVNGILNDSDYAPGLLGYHINEARAEGFKNIGIYTLFYNPTEGIIGDGLETFQDKMSFVFGPSDVAKKLSGALDTIQQGDQSVKWVVHSQGGAIFASAVDYHGGTLSNNSVAFHAGANNQLVTDSILKNAGMNFNDNGIYKTVYLDSPRDAVPNIIGLNTLNPITWIRSILFIPTLFMGPESSPHTLPPKSTP